MTTVKKYEVSYPPEPPVGTVVETRDGLRFKRFIDDPALPWRRIDEDGELVLAAIANTWDSLMAAFSSGLTDVTPARVYELPEMPPVGTRLRGIDTDGDEIELIVRRDAPEREPYLYTEACPIQWSAALAMFGPLTEIR